MAAEQPKKVTGGAFGQYMKENRAALLEECKGKPATASLKLGSERFKALDASEKQKFEDKFKAAKKKYETDLAAFLAEGGELQARKSKKDKKEKAVKDPNRPKKPAGGAFGCFLAKNRSAFIKECEGKPITAITKLASERWKVLPASERAIFETEYQANAAAYKKAMETYEPPAGAEDKEEEDGEEVSPKKRKADTKAGAGKATPPKSRRVSKGSKGAPQKDAVKLDDDVLKQAQALKMEGSLKNLASRSEIVALNLPSNKIFEALRAADGLVNKAKSALMGA